MKNKRSCDKCNCVTNDLLFEKLVLNKGVLNVSRYKIILNFKQKKKKKILGVSDP